MLKSFEELMKIDVTPYCDMRDAKDERGGLDLRKGKIRWTFFNYARP